MGNIRVGSRRHKSVVRQGYLSQGFCDGSATQPTAAIATTRYSHRRDNMWENKHFIYDKTFID